MQVAKPGSPWQRRRRFAPMPEQVEYGTSHLSVVDGYGNALAMTSTIEDAFGARQMVRGFLLNNQLSDFSFTCRATATARRSPTASSRASARARR
jgi:gamma-glutamyltranspeptidase/glutathione hydrolase